MIVTVVSSKGGVGKTTTAVHLAAYLSTQGTTLLLDGDQTKNATAWALRAVLDASREGKSGFPFPVKPIELAAKLAPQFQHLVIDTGQRPKEEDLQAAAEGSDLLVIPTMASALDTDGLGQTIRALAAMNSTNYKVLLTRVAPDAGRETAELRGLLKAAKAPMFKAEIPRLKAFEKAAAAGVVVCEVDDRNAARAWAAYVAVGKELRSVLDASREGKSK